MAAIIPDAPPPIIAIVFIKIHILLLS